ncbi:hypothetical protein SANBI_003364 [Sanguibacter sp. 4.1]|uniref:Septum formation-related domain-containing protein n=2 Tax=Sanguibacter TaxID=60919 RepID=A0AAF0Z8D6_9MICO|nr:hypothetical protein [Sanguibacter sp. 4.1]KQT99554.1 hypothetical protein ASG53_01445 [Sanguibacter sp. Leaf3]WPF82033.1 hypothetical protein SANBI_003364 [Sanguibacter sp. 4.1]
MVAAAAAVTIGVFGACGVAPDAESPEATPGRLVEISEVAREDCLVVGPLVDGQVTVVDCGADDAVPVVGLAAVGDDAPDIAPAAAILNGFAQSACQPSFDAYAIEVDEPLTGKNLISVIDEATWSGVGTTVLCAVGEPE